MWYSTRWLCYQDDMLWNYNYIYKWKKHMLQKTVFCHVRLFDFWDAIFYLQFVFWGWYNLPFFGFDFCFICGLWSEKNKRKTFDPSTWIDGQGPFTTSEPPVSTSLKSSILTKVCKVMLDSARFWLVLQDSKSFCNACNLTKRTVVPRTSFFGL